MNYVALHTNRKAVVIHNAIDKGLCVLAKLTSAEMFNSGSALQITLLVCPRVLLSRQY